MDTKCPVCCDEIATMPAERRLFTLACDHLFCAPCIESWFGRESTCPTCRRTHTSLRRCAQSTVGAWLSEYEEERGHSRRALGQSPLSAEEAEGSQRERDDGGPAAAQKTAGRRRVTLRPAKEKASKRPRAPGSAADIRRTTRQRGGCVATRPTAAGIRAG